MESNQALFAQRAADKMEELKKIRAAKKLTAEYRPPAQKINCPEPPNHAEVLPLKQTDGASDTLVPENEDQAEKVIGHNIPFLINRSQTYATTVDGDRVYVTSPFRLTHTQVQEKGRQLLVEMDKGKGKRKGRGEDSPSRPKRTRHSKQGKSSSADVYKSQPKSALVKNLRKAADSIQDQLDAVSRPSFAYSLFRS